MSLSVSKPIPDSARIPIAGRGRAPSHPDPDGKGTRVRPGTPAPAADATLSGNRHEPARDSTRSAPPGRHPATLVYTYEPAPDGGYRIVDTAVTLKVIDEPVARKAVADTEDILATIVAAHTGQPDLAASRMHVGDWQGSVEPGPTLDVAPAASRALRAYVSAAAYFQSPTAHIDVTA
jgi:hypothetical protein